MPSWSAWNIWSLPSTSPPSVWPAGHHRIWIYYRGARRIGHRGGGIAADFSDWRRKSTRDCRHPRHGRDNGNPHSSNAYRPGRVGHSNRARAESLLGCGCLHGTEGQTEGSGNGKTARGGDTHGILLSTSWHRPVRCRVVLNNQKLCWKAWWRSDACHKAVLLGFWDADFPESHGHGRDSGAGPWCQGRGTVNFPKTDHSMSPRAS